MRPIFHLMLATAMMSIAAIQPAPAQDDPTAYLVTYIDALPAEHRFDLDIADIAEVWRRGSVIPSWLLDLTASALARNDTLDNYSGFVEDSGEGRWTVNAAIDEAVPAEVLTAALFARFRSRKEHTFAEKILSAMRDGFGGHKEPQQHSDPARQTAPEIVKPKADRS